MSPLCLGVALALVITVRAHGGVPAPLTRGELKALCTIDASATQTCVGYIAGVSDELSTTVWHLGDAKATALVAPCPGNQMAELLISLLTDLDAGPNSSLSDPALPTVQFILHPPLGCRGSRPALPSITVFADGARLKAYCTGSDRDERLQCEGYIRAVADMTLRVLRNPEVRRLKDCLPTWQTPDQAVGASIVYLNAHPEQGKVPAPYLIKAALLPPSCMLAPKFTSPR